MRDQLFNFFDCYSHVRVRIYIHILCIIFCHIPLLDYYTKCAYIDGCCIVLYCLFIGIIVNP